MNATIDILQNINNWLDSYWILQRILKQDNNIGMDVKMIVNEDLKVRYILGSNYRINVYFDDKIELIVFLKYKNYEKFINKINELNDMIQKSKKYHCKYDFDNKFGTFKTKFFIYFDTIDKDEIGKIIVDLFTFFDIK
jgi:hypothetical protein